MIKVKGCNNCPFKAEEVINIFETRMYCNLATFLTNIISDIDDIYKVPDFCPLKEGNIEIQLEETNK